MKLVLLVCVMCVLTSVLVSSELQQDETRLIKAPESSLQERKDKFIETTSAHLMQRHLPKMITGMKQSARMIRQVLKRPKIILVPKSKKSTTLRVHPILATSNHHYQMKYHKKPMQMPIKDNVQITHHHTYSEEHIHVNEDDENNDSENKKNEDPKKHGSEQTRNEYLKELELREEKRVEEAMSHHDNGGGSASFEIIHGKPYDFDDDWKPIEKPKPASRLNTYVMDQPIAKQVHHHKHIIELEFENKSKHVAEIKSLNSKHTVKPATYSTLNYHSKPKIYKEETSKEANLLKGAETVNANYFYKAKINEPDYLQSNPSNKVEIKSKQIHVTTTSVPPVTTTHRQRAAPNYSFRINPIEMPISNSPTETSKTESVRSLRLVESKKHKNLVAQTMSRGAMKFGASIEH